MVSALSLLLLKRPRCYAPISVRSSGAAVEYTIMSRRRGPTGFLPSNTNESATRTAVNVFAMTLAAAYSLDRGRMKPNKVKSTQYHALRPPHKQWKAIALKKTPQSTQITCHRQLMDKLSATGASLGGHPAARVQKPRQLVLEAVPTENNKKLAINFLIESKKTSARIQNNPPSDTARNG